MKRKVCLKWFTTVLVTVAVLTLVGGVLSQAQGAKYIVGTSADWPPFEWVDGNTNYVGFDLDVMRAIAIEKGYEIEIIDMAWDSLIPALQSGKIDINAADLTITPDRAKVISYSDPYWASNFDAIVRADSGLNIITALSLGHKVGVQRGTTQNDFADGLVEAGVDVALNLYETNDLAILDLLSGRIDTFIGDSPAAEAFQKVNSDNLVNIGTIRTGEYAGFAVQKDDPKGILPLLNDGMAILQANGVWDDLVAAYMTGNLDKITDCYAQFKHYLTVEKDTAAYAKNLAACMTAK